MAGSYDNVYTRLLAAKSCLDRRDNVHPGEPCPLDLLIPAQGVAG
jgi:hypothetical protein